MLRQSNISPFPTTILEKQRFGKVEVVWPAQRIEWWEGVLHPSPSIGESPLCPFVVIVVVVVVGSSSGSASSATARSSSARGPLPPPDPVSPPQAEGSAAPPSSRGARGPNRATAPCRDYALLIRMGTNQGAGVESEGRWRRRRR